VALVEQPVYWSAVVAVYQWVGAGLVYLPVARLSAYQAALFPWLPAHSALPQAHLEGHPGH